MQAIGRNMDLDEVRNEILKIKKERQNLQGPQSSEEEDEEDPELDFEEFIKLIGDEMLDGMKEEELMEAF